MSDTSVTFVADELIAEAVGQTGFEDFGEPSYREGLEVLLATYDRISAMRVDANAAATGS